MPLSAGGQRLAAQMIPQLESSDVGASTRVKTCSGNTRHRDNSLFRTFTLLLDWLHEHAEEPGGPMLHQSCKWLGEQLGMKSVPEAAEMQ